MQIKTIEKNIIKKLNEWLETITDEDLRRDIKHNLLVSGGCITSMLLNEDVNDYDVYFMNMDTCKKVAQYYSKQFENIVIFDGREKPILIDIYNSNRGILSNEIDTKDCSGEAVSLRNLKENQIKLYFAHSAGGLRVNESENDSNPMYVPLFFSPNAISLSNHLQVVLRFWGTAEEIHKTFDFIHATNYFTFKDGLVRNLPAIESILTKQLKYQGSLYPVTSIIRAKKFIKRNWNVNAGELLKIMYQISQLSLSDPDVLEEQLIGIDVAYFQILIEALRNKYNADEGFSLTTEYFNVLIDRIFNSNEELIN